MPTNILWAIVGFVLCFFGGMYPATIAAIEAWSLCGGKEAIQDLKDLWHEGCKVKEASDADDSKDSTGTGKADVDELTPAALLERKTSLALKTVDPQTLNGALAGLYTGWVGVLAILKMQFAK